MDRDELRAKVLAHEEEMKKQVYIADDHVVINVVYEYNIPLNRCDTIPKILGWVDHLCEKTWINPEVLRRFIRLAAQQHSLEIPQG